MMTSTKAAPRVEKTPSRREGGLPGGHPPLRRRAVLAAATVALLGVLLAPVWKGGATPLERVSALQLLAAGDLRRPIPLHPLPLALAEGLLLAALLMSRRFPVPAYDPADEELLHIVSHDLRAPLHATEGYIKYLVGCEPGSLNREQLELLNTALNNLNRLEHFISDTLDLAKIDAGAMRYDMEEAELGPVVEEGFLLFRFAAQEKGVELESALPEGLPAVRMDKEKIGRVLANLLSNALKFTEAGGRVAVSAAREGNALRVAVSDTGIGIPAEHLPGLFDRFTAAAGAQGPRGRLRSTGLGLWIVRGIVTGHGGEVGVESKAGVGSTFWFKLPLG